MKKDSKGNETDVVKYGQLQAESPTSHFLCSVIPIPGHVVFFTTEELQELGRDTNSWQSFQDDGTSRTGTNCNGISRTPVACSVGSGRRSPISSKSQIRPLWWQQHVAKGGFGFAGFHLSRSQLHSHVLLRWPLQLPGSKRNLPTAVAFFKDWGLDLGLIQNLQHGNTMKNMHFSFHTFHSISQHFSITIHSCSSRIWNQP